MRKNLVRNELWFAKTPMASRRIPLVLVYPKNLEPLMSSNLAEVESQALRAPHESQRFYIALAVSSEATRRSWRSRQQAVALKIGVKGREAGSFIGSGELPTPKVGLSLG